ncbi:MAG: hypothetical protein K0S34_459, partial [Bacillales bacterium]|nr:hypothetical protein [Bacillales bacterium]
PATKWSRGVAVNMPACHAGDRRFDPGRDRHLFFGSVAQSVEQRTENPRVGGSIPSRPSPAPYGPIAQLVRAHA